MVMPGGVPSDFGNPVAREWPLLSLAILGMEEWKKSKFGVSALLKKKKNCNNHSEKRLLAPIIQPPSCFARPSGHIHSGKFGLPGNFPQQWPILFTCALASQKLYTSANRAPFLIFCFNFVDLFCF